MRTKKQPRQLCLVCGNEIKRRYGSAFHTCDCPPILERAGIDFRITTIAAAKRKRARARA